MTVSAQDVQFSNHQPAAPSGWYLTLLQVTGANPVYASFAARNLGGVDARTTTTETIHLASMGELVTFNNAGAIAVTLDSTVPNYFLCAVQVIGAGAATLTPSTGTINGLASVTIGGGSNQGGLLFFNGTNWWLLSSGGGGSPLTTKGDLFTYSTTNARLAVGADKTVLMADSSQTDGIGWKTPRGNTFVPQLADSTINPTAGNLAVFDANGNVKDGGAPSSGGGGGISSDVSHTSGIVSPVSPPTSGWSWVNQGSASITQVDSALCLHIPDNAALNWRLRVRSVSGTYTVIAHMRVVGWAANSQTAGLYLYDSGSGKLTGAEYLIQAPAAGGDPPAQTLRVERMNSVTVDNSTQATFGTFGFAPPLISFKIVEDGTHRTWYVSRDCGLNWYQLLQETTGSFITPNNVGFGGVSVTGTSTLYVDNDLLSWTGA